MISLEPVNNQFFHIEWESTLKCNLDCSYCGDGHNNNIPHPSLEDSIKTVDFIFEYVSLYMKTYPKDMRHASLNVYGGESMFHPHILDILTYATKRREEYEDFSFNINTITNAVVGENTWKEISNFLDHYTISYHSESLPKQQEMIKRNILFLKEIGKSFHVTILMHPQYWDNCIKMIEWCENNNVSYSKRQIDHSWTDRRFNYSREQAEFLYGKTKVTSWKNILINSIDLSSKGRECCGRVPLYVDRDYSKTETFVKNNFKGWNCSVNKFFLYIRQTTGEIFTNKDCKMNLDNKVGPIGYLQESDKILSVLKTQIETNSLPTIKCKKNSCWCGLCTPKALLDDDYKQIMTKYENC